MSHPKSVGVSKYIFSFRIGREIDRLISTVPHGKLVAAEISDWEDLITWFCKTDRLQYLRLPFYIFYYLFLSSW